MDGQGMAKSPGPWPMIGVLLRTIAYATVFIGVVLVCLPVRALAWAGVARPERLGLPEVLGAIATLAGAGLAVWCILSFAVLGHGTPAPFDPPRRLVVRGPYRYLRNPKYLGAGLALAGAALLYRSGALLAYAGASCCSCTSSSWGTRSRRCAGASARTTTPTASGCGAGGPSCGPGPTSPRPRDRRPRLARCPRR